MPDNDLTSKAEAAMKSVVDALSLTGVTSNTGQDDDTLALPCVVCSVQQGQEQPLGTGNFVLTCRVAVYSSNDAETLAAHRTRTATVFDAFMDDAISATLSAAVSGFYAYPPWDRRTGKEINEEAFVDYLELDILAAAADL